MISNPVSVIEQVWKPHPKQEQFIQVPFDVAEGLYGGAAGGGKSELLVMLPLIYGFHRHRQFKGIILRRTNPELESEIIGRAHSWYPATGAIWNEGKKRYTWKDEYGNDAAQMRFGHAELEKDIRKYDGVEYNYIGFDEATSFTEFQYLYLVLTRRRSPTVDLPAIARSATNPGNVGHIFFRTRFVDPYRFGGKIIRDSKTGIRRFYLQSLATDNPTLMLANPRYLDDMKGLPDVEYKAKALGDWYTYSGMVFVEFRLEPISGEPQSARHVIPQFKIPSYWPKIIAIDWGYSANTVILWGAVSPDGRVYVYRVYCEKHKLIEQWTSDLVRLTSSDEFEMVRDVVICHSANQHRGEPHTIQQQAQSALLKELGNECPRVRLGKRDRLGGKMLVHEFLRWIPRSTEAIPIEKYDDELSQKIFRLYGIDKYKEYLSLFKEREPEINLPKLQILESSPEGTSNEALYNCIPLCQYNDKGSKDTAPEDVKEFDGDDAYDCLRMLVEGVDRYVSESKDEQEKLNERDKIINQFNNSNDATSFYRRMEHLERSNNSVKAIRRYHR